MADKVVQLIWSHARDSPESIALETSNKSITFRQLKVAVDQLSSLLKAQGVRVGDEVPILTSRSIEGVACMIAVLDVGACYIPIDYHGWTLERTTSILDSIQPRVLMTTCDAIENTPTTIVVRDICAYVQENTELRTMENHLCYSPNDPAYVIFTSGSTGAPKGVMIAAKSLLHYVQQHPYNLGVRPGDRVAVIMSIAFDACTCTLFSTLCNGGTAVLSNPSTFHRDLMNCTILPCTPSLLHSLPQSNDYKMLRSIFLGGEAPDPLLIRRWSTGATTLYNCYGTTETTCTSLIASLEPGNQIMLGRAIPGSTIYVLNDQMIECDEGELAISGIQLATGYYKDEARTTKHFVSWNGHRIYRTGDYVRSTSNGLEYVGRRDSFVKNRGILIHLESQVIPAVQSHPEVETAAALKYRSKLIAFVCPSTINSSNLRKWLAAKFDNSLVPDEIHSIVTLPLTVNGKIDNKVLINILAKLHTPTLHQALGRDDARSQMLKKIMAHVLDIPTSALKSDCSFWDLGGDSLRAISLLSHLHQEGLTISMGQLFSSANLAEILDGLVGISVPGPFIPGISADKKEINSSSVSLMPQQLHMLRSSVRTPLTAHILVEIKLAACTVDRSWEALRDAWRTTMTRHQVFAAVTDLVEGTQTFTNTAFNWLHTRTTNETDYTSQVGKISKEILCQASKMSSENVLLPTNAFHLITSTTSEATLFWLVHHSLIDGWSISIIVEEVNAILHGKSLAPAPLLSNFLQALHAFVESKKLELEAFWEINLREFQANQPLKIGLPREQSSSPLRSVASKSLDISRREIEAASHLLSTSHVSIFYTAWALLLSEYTSDHRVVFGTVVSGRTFAWPQVERLVGPLINLCPFAIRLEDEEVSATLARVKEQVYKMIDHQWAFSTFSEDTNARQLGAKFNTLISVEYDLPDTVRPNFIGDWPSSVKRQDFPEFDLTLFIEIEEGKLATRAVFDPAFFTPEIVDRMLKHFSNIVRHLVTPGSKSIRLSDVRVNMLDPEERSQLTAVQTPLPHPKTTLENVKIAFEHACDKWPNTVALEGPDGMMTYAQADDASNAVAASLLRIVRSSEIVAVLSDGSMMWVIVMLGIFKAGLVYAPIDVSLPPTRIKFVLEKSKAALCVTFAKQIGETDLVAITPFVSAATLLATAPDRTRLQTQIRSDMSAYLICTSGSTGQPKPVLIMHRSLSAFLSDPRVRLSSGPGRRHSQMFSVGFDVSIAEVLVAICFGSTLVLKNSADPTKHLHTVHTAMFTPSLFATLTPEELPDLDTVLLAGEAVPQPLADRWSSKVSLYNGYGPCEATILCLIKHLEPGSSVTLGTPVSDTNVYILNQNKRPVPVGTVGEICVAGVQVAEGYFEIQEHSAKFMKDPFRGDHLMYCTGDLAMWTEDMDIVFLGRKDHQVKVRGFRVELQDIENNMHAIQHDIKQAGAVLLEDSETIVSLVSPREVDVIPLKKQLAAVLPPYSVPAAIYAVDRLPTTSNQKLDRAEMTMLARKFYSTTACSKNPAESLGTATQKTISEAFKSVLNLANDAWLNENDDFLALGGHSLRQLRLAQYLSKVIGASIPLRLILKHTRLIDLADAIDHWKLDQIDCLSPSFTDPDLAQDDTLSRLEEEVLEAHEMSTSQHAFNLGVKMDFEGSINVDHLQGAVDDVLKQHEIFRTTFCPKSSNGVPSRRVVGTNPPQLRCRKRQHLDLRDIAHMLDRKIDLRNGYPIEGELLIAKDKITLFFIMHHIIADKQTVQHLIDDIKQRYRGRPISDQNLSFPQMFQESDVPYRLWAAWERRHRTDITPERQLFWREYFKKIPPLPFSKATVHTGEEAELLTAKIRELNCNLSTEMLVAATAVAIQVVTGIQDVVVAVSHMDRSQPGTERMFGLFLDRIPVKVSLAQFSDVASLSTTIARDVRSCLSNVLPYQTIRKNVGAILELFDVLVTYHRNDEDHDSHPSSDPQTTHHICRPKNAVQFPLLIELFETRTEINLHTTYKPNLISKTEACTIQETIQKFLTGVRGLAQPS